MCHKNIYLFDYQIIIVENVLAKRNVFDYNLKEGSSNSSCG